MSTTPDLRTQIDEIKQRFLSLTGLSAVEVTPESAGPEVFLRFLVGRDAPLYRRTLTEIDQTLPQDHPFHGRLSLKAEQKQDVLYSAEIELLRSLISRSLRVTSDIASKGPIVKFVPFRGGEENRVIQPTNHAILGRRGVGKSSLILMAYQRLLRDGNLPIWIDLQGYHRRNEPFATLEVLREIFQETVTSTNTHFNITTTDSLDKTLRLINQASDDRVSLNEVRGLVPQLRSSVRDFTKSVNKQLFVFLDDAHLLGSELQPFLFDLVHSVLKGGGGWLKIAGVKNLLRLYDPPSQVGLQAPNDVQLISLDLTLVDPAAARDHLTGVLRQFLEPCGFKRSGEIILNRSIDRLVWCCAGVPRDFLWLLERSIAFAIQHRRRRVGVQEVNLAVGEFGQEKMSELEQDTSSEGSMLREALDRLQSAALDQNKSNSFLIRLDTKHPGYVALRKLVDLRLVHLIHPTITPSRAGERFEAYLLDYSFYTGLRRRHGLAELQINANEPPKYATLRKLPRIDLDVIINREEVA